MFGDEDDEGTLELREEQLEMLSSEPTNEHYPIALRYPIHGYLILALFITISPPLNQLNHLIQPIHRAIALTGTVSSVPISTLNTTSILPIPQSPAIYISHSPHRPSILPPRTPTPHHTNGRRPHRTSSQTPRRAPSLLLRKLLQNNRRHIHPRRLHHLCKNR